MKAYEFHFTVTGINKAQAGKIMRVVINMIAALQSMSTATGMIQMSGGFEEIEYEEDQVREANRG